MRPALALSLFGLNMLCSGCALFEDANRNLLGAVTTPIETHKEIARNRRWADTAWQKTCVDSGPRQFSSDYAQGFKDGYAEHLFRGGDGEPPLLAPLHYRHLRYQTPQGYVAVEDWFAGYRHGAAVAHDTGARRWITGPTGLLCEPPGSVDHAPMPHPVERSEPLPLTMPKHLPKMSLEPKAPEGVTIDVETPMAPAALVELPRARIMGVSVPPPEFPEAQAPPSEPAVRIKGIHVAPTVVPEASVEPVRVRIRAVTPATPRD
jgi:hypothetical protein